MPNFVRVVVSRAPLAMLGSTGGYHDHGKRYPCETRDTKLCTTTALSSPIADCHRCAAACRPDDDDGGGLSSVLKCRCLPSWCRLRRTKLEVLLLLLLIGGVFYQQQEEAACNEQLEAQQALTENYMQSAA
jgi:hypothetical protein